MEFLCLFDRHRSLTLTYAINLLFRKSLIGIIRHQSLASQKIEKPSQDISVIKHQRLGMLFYVRCPSCGRVISDNVKTWYEESSRIRDDPSLSVAEKEEQTAELIKSLYRKICCRIRIMGLIPYDEIVITAVDRSAEKNVDGAGGQAMRFLA